MPLEMDVYGDWNDSVDLFIYGRDTFLLCGDRDDIDKILKHDFTKRPCIYILMDDENHRYVGQASSKNGAHSRLSKHQRKKDWWTKVVFFGLPTTDSALEASQLNYLERLLIEKFKAAGFEMDNENAGISTYIDRRLERQINDFWFKAERLWRRALHVDPFKTTRIRKPKKALVDAPVVTTADPTMMATPTSTTVGVDGSLPTVTIPAPVRNHVLHHSDYTISDVMGVSVTQKSFAKAQLAYLQEVYKDSASRAVLEQLSLLPNKRLISANEWNVLDAKEKKWYREIGPDLFVYSNLSSQDREKLLLTLDNSLQRGVAITKH